MHRLHDVTDDVNLEHLGKVELVKFLNCTGTLLPILLVCPCVCTHTVCFASILPGTTECSRLIWTVACHSSRRNYFSKGLCFGLSWGVMPQQRQP